MKNANAVVIFGATGDLVGKKIFPALFRLSKDQPQLDFAIISVARRELSEHEFQTNAKNAVSAASKTAAEAELKSFADRISYLQGSFEDENLYTRLAKKIKGLENKKSCNIRNLLHRKAQRFTRIKVRLCNRS